MADATEVVRTPDDRFTDLPDWPWPPRYDQVQVDGLDLRLARVDEGPPDAQPVVLLHGEPTWGFLWRHVVPPLLADGHRVVVPDLVGFGRSDKPTSMDTHTYAFHVGVMTELVEALDLQGVAFFGQDWGGLIGLRVVAENPDRFARVVVSNTGLPVGRAGGPSEAFMAWKRMNQQMIDRGDMPVGAMVARNVGDPAIEAAYDAPFPEPSYKAGPLIMPQRVPVTADDPANEANTAAWKVFAEWDKPFLTAFGDSDPITGGGDRVFQQRVPGAQGQPHAVVEGAGHFIQESHGAELARIIAEWIASLPED